MLVNGLNLNPETKAEVLRAYVYRLTTENGYPERNPCGAKVPAVSDEEWLKDHCFHVNEDGSLDGRYKHCEPHYMEDAESNAIDMVDGPRCVDIDYVVMVLGYFGIAKTIKEAAQNCKNAGAMKSDKALVKAVVEPKIKTYVDDGGSIHYKSDHILVDVMKWVTIGTLLKLEE